MALVPPQHGHDWLRLSYEPLPPDAVRSWVELPACGAVVLFTGNVRDSSEGRPGVTVLEYEAYEEEVEVRLAAIAIEARCRWAEVGRLAMLHRVGRLAVGECSVVVAASAPHREEAFAAARFCIDSVKLSVPIWKRETWAGGQAWANCAHVIEEPADVGAAVAAPAAPTRS
jgi:molybdopterin synthase catalytic subunit